MQKNVVADSLTICFLRGLADVNGDGQMDLNEFSIACKLINMKLKGFELPSALPPSLLVIPQVGVATPIPGAVQQPPVSIMTSSIPSVMPQQAMGAMGAAMPMGAPG